MMDFKRWLAEEQLRTHKTNKEEIRGLLEIVQRDLNDALFLDWSCGGVGVGGFDSGYSFRD